MPTELPDNIISGTCLKSANGVQFFALQTTHPLHKNTYAIWIFSKSESGGWKLNNCFAIPGDHQVLDFVIYKCESVLLLTKLGNKNDSVYYWHLIAIPENNMAQLHSMNQSVYSLIEKEGAALLSSAASTFVTTSFSRPKHFTDSLFTYGGRRKPSKMGLNEDDGEKRAFVAGQVHCSLRGICSLLEKGKRHVVAYEFVDWDKVEVPETDKSMEQAVEDDNDADVLIDE